MNILFISNLFPPHYLGGYEILCAQVRDLLEARGHHIYVLTSDHGTNRDHNDHNESRNNVARRLALFRPFSQPSPSLQRIKRWRVSRRNEEITRTVIDKICPDVIFIWSQLRLTLGAARAAQASGIPTVYTFNDEHIASYIQPTSQKIIVGTIKQLFDKFLFKDIFLPGLSLQYTTCISSHVKHSLLQKGVPIDACRVIYQGIPIEKFPTKPCPGKLHNPVRLLYVGQLLENKGVHTFLDAISILETTIEVPLIVSIAGTGTSGYQERLRMIASRMRSPVAFLGRLPHQELPAIYREHDIFAFPSAGPEAFGLTHLEAMASGTPVISTTEGGHGEFIIDGDNALTFPKKDSKALAAQLSRIIRDEHLRIRLANKGRTIVATNFTMERYVSDLEQLINDAHQKRHL